jgi:hypothetical protein
MMKKAVLLLAFLFAALPAFGQGASWQTTVITNVGRPVAGASVTVCTHVVNPPNPCTNLATIYGNVELSGSPIANPTVTDGYGNVTIYIAPGTIDYTVSGNGIQTITYVGITVGGSGGGGGGSPGGSNSEVQFNNQGAFAGAAGLTTNSTGTDLVIKGPIPYIDVTSYMPQGGCANDGDSFSPPSGTMTSGSPNLATNFNNGITNGCGVFVANAGAQSTLSTPSQGGAPAPIVVGTAGSTTVHYKIVAVDANYGTSAASAAITVTTAPSTRTPTNYVAINWTSVANAAGYLVYTDQTGGGTYVPLTYSFTCFAYVAGYQCGAVDKGAETNSFSGYQSFWPQTPPASATYQALITTVVSGGGTNSLVLAANAAHSVSNVFTFPDNSPFILSAMTAAATLGQFNKAQVQIPPGLWFTSTVPYPTSSTDGILIRLQGQLEVFGLPIEGALGPNGGSGKVAIDGSQGGGTYTNNDFTMNCANISGYPTLGSVFVAANGSLSLNNICIVHDQVGITQADNGYVTTRNMEFERRGSGVAYQIDNNSYFSLFDRTDWNASNGCTGDNIPEIWFLGLTNSGHTSVFDFRDNSFICHAVRTDQPAGGNVGGTLVFDGTTNIESGEFYGFIETADCQFPQDVTLDNIATGDIMGSNESVFYGFGSCNGVGPSINIHGQTTGFLAGIFGTTTPYASETYCRNLTYETSNQGGSGTQSIGLWGNIDGYYSGCDFGSTSIGTEVQTTSILTSGGNDALGSAGEMMVGQVFRRPITTLTCSNSGGSLAAGTYYIEVAFLDVAARVTAPSPEQSCTTTGTSGSVAVSAAGGIYFPASANVYFGTSSGGETHYFNSTSVTNGTVTFTLMTTSGESSGSPAAVGNAMRQWLSEENNDWSCIPACGNSNGGTGGLGIFLNNAQYATMKTAADHGLWVGGPLNLPSLSASTLCLHLVANVVTTTVADCATNSWSTLSAGTNSGGGSFIQTGATWDVHGDSHTLPVITASTSGGLPATCTVGELSFVTGATAGQNIYECGATNTWTQQLNSGSAGMSTSGSNAASTAVGASWIPGAANSYALGSTALPWTNVFIGLAANESVSFTNLGSLTANRTIFVPNANSMAVQTCAAGTNTFVSAWPISTAQCTQSNISASATMPYAYAADSGSATAYVVALTPAIASYTTGLEVDFLPANSNSGTTPTLNVNSVGAQTITKFGATALSIGDLATTQIAKVIWDGTYWELQNPNTLSSTLTTTSTSTLTNKTINAESTGNNISYPAKAFWPAAGCSGGSTAGPGIVTGSTNAPTPNCVGSTVPKGVLQFAHGNIAYISSFQLPSDWNSSASTDIQICATTTDTTSGHTIIWDVQTGFNSVTGAATDDPSLNAQQQLTVTLGGSQVSGGEICGSLTSMTMTSAAAGYNFEVLIKRDSSDTVTDTAVAMKYLTITLGRTMNAANR